MEKRTDLDIREGLTFDDVLLVPAMSEVLPGQVDVSTRLTETMVEYALLSRLWIQSLRPGWPWRWRARAGWA